MNDWRITNQRDYLYGKILKKCKISQFPLKDHEHCSFCWEKFGDFEGMLEEGYCTEDGAHWICLECFSDFKKMFNWKTLGEQN